MQLDKGTECFEYQDALLEMTGSRSVPRVFIGGKFLGGGDDTVRAAADGVLQKLLTEAGVV
jgi:glutaredoxin 3